MLLVLPVQRLDRQTECNKRLKEYDIWEATSAGHVNIQLKLRIKLH